MDYLVSHGLAGFVGRFAAPGDAVFSRGDGVVVRTIRGLEAGEVLDAAQADSLNHARPGELVRPMTADDRQTLADRRALASTLLDAAQIRVEAGDLPVMFLDAEVLLDGAQAIIQAVHWEACDLSELFETLSSDFGLLVTLQDLTATPVVAEKSGCSSCGSSEGGGCSTGGECSTGGCSKGKVKSAGELTEYFTGLREQMEARSARISLQ